MIAKFIKGNYQLAQVSRPAAIRYFIQLRISSQNLKFPSRVCIQQVMCRSKLNTSIRDIAHKQRKSVTQRVMFASKKAKAVTRRPLLVSKKAKAVAREPLFVSKKAKAVTWEPLLLSKKAKAVTREPLLVSWGSMLDLRLYK